MRTSKICNSVSRLAWAVCEWLVELGEERTFRLLWSTLLNPQMQKLKPCKGEETALPGRQAESLRVPPSPYFLLFLLPFSPLPPSPPLSPLSSLSSSSPPPPSVTMSCFCYFLNLLFHLNFGSIYQMISDQNIHWGCKLAE